MSDHTREMIEFVGSSHNSVESAVQNAITNVARDAEAFGGSRWRQSVST